MGRIRSFCSIGVLHNNDSDGINPNAIIPDPKIAGKLKSDSFRRAPTEFKSNSGQALPKATKVTATKNFYNCLKHEI